MLKGLLLAPKSSLDFASTSTFESAFRGRFTILRDAFADLIELENDALESALQGDASLLNAMIEGGSIEANRIRATASEPLRAPILRALQNAKGGLSGTPTTVLRYFSGPYFGYAQGVELQALLHAVSIADPAARPALLGVLLSVASHVVGTVGKQFAQPMRLLKAGGRAQPLLVVRSVRDRRISIWSEYRRWLSRWHDALAARKYDDNTVAEGDAATVLAASRMPLSAIYADPPYTIDHYSRFYHVLETISRGDDPGLQLDRKGVPLRGLYRPDRYQSPFCIPSEVAAAFGRLFSSIASKSVPLLLSYSDFEASSRHRPRVMTMEGIKRLASTHFRTVEVLSAGPHSHRKLNATHVNSATNPIAEYFLICRP